MNSFNILSVILEMSMTASIVIAVVMVLRCFLGKAPKLFSYVLWSVVLFRLLCPVSIDTSFSAMGVLKPAVIQQGHTIISNHNKVHTVTQNQQQVTPLKKNITKSKTSLPTEIETQEEKDSFLETGFIVWILGMVGMMTVNGLSFLSYRKRLIGAVHIRDNIYMADHITSPFVIGIINPKIYLLSSLDEKEQEYILMHEQTHIRRGDHIIKLLAFLALAIHWFNPFVWVAFYFAGKDMEMSCDEAVMKKMNSDIRADYSTSLLNLAIGKNIISGTPVAFGEGDTKARIKNIMHYKKPAVVVIIAAVVVVTGTLFTLGSNPKNLATAKVVQVKDPEGEKIANLWAQTFCDRDYDKVLAMTTQKVQDNLVEEGIMEKGEDGYFGYSSPWPWDSEEDYEVISCTDSSAEILYYAMVSDPHVTVWREEISFEKNGEDSVITKEELKQHDDIATEKEFMKAYPNGLIGLPIDYSTNELRENLNNNAKEDEDSPFYKELLEPETAARYLLNLTDDEKIVEITKEKTEEIMGEEEVTVTINFTKEGKRIPIKMCKRKGEVIYIPKF